jgi:hypothetical protein
LDLNRQCLVPQKITTLRRSNYPIIRNSLKNVELKRTAVFLLILAIALTSCEKEISKNVDQAKIWTHYELSYSEAENKTHATATFRFSNENGTKLMLSDPSTVSVDGAELEWKSDNGYYQTEFNGLKATASFNWVDLDGNSYINDIELRDVSFPNPVNNLFFQDSITSFMWAGLALDSNESVSLTIDGVGETDRRIFSVDTIGATTVTFDSLALSQIDSGMVSMVLNKRHSPLLLEQTERGGLIIGRYQTDTVQVLLTD